MLDLEDAQQALGNKFIQDEPTNLIKGIEIQHLYKVSALKSSENFRNSV